MRQSILPILAAVALAACVTSPSPTSLIDTPTPAGLATFHENGLVFEYPAAWRVFHYSEVSSFSNLVAYLATVDVPDPCTRSANETSCSNRWRLDPDSLVVSVRSNGHPTFDIMQGRPPGAQPMTVGGLPAYLEPESAADLGLGADVGFIWTISMPGSVDNFYTISADIRGPDVARLRGEVDALVASLRYDPAVVPLSTVGGAAALAASKALATMARDSPVWNCFPPGEGTRQLVITALVMGPDLARPQLATCTTTIEATPLQLWRMTLTLRLPHPDPQGGSGQTIILWVDADGTPGETMASQIAP